MESITSFISRLPKECPHLRELNVNHDPGRSSVFVALSEPLKTLNHIASIAHYTPLDMTTWAHLVSLKTLKCISFSNCLNAHAPVIRSTPQTGFDFLVESPNAFPAVQEMVLYANSCDPYLSLIRACGSPFLSEIDILIRLPFSPFSSRQFISILSEKLSLTSIKSDCSGKRSRRDLPLRRPPDLSISLRPLSMLHNLVSFIWGTSYSFDDLGDSTMTDLVASWPSLRCLRLDPLVLDSPVLSHQTEPPSVALRGLLPLASHPLLSEISIPLIAQASDILPSSFFPANGHSRVTSLRLGQWMVIEEADGDLEAMARYLRFLFPICDQTYPNGLNGQQRKLQALVNSEK
ncbi:hypothetical protein JAAARDRAFT_200154 [Jaapia argillacea MUCL 33604]|uniref:F-box domain-containing protein n=1 Tax=Jaapia argillacea MUCL 33604 TaxID=933084 RepID=A0A067PGY0_9AGAM|nr:hypothetical protein JAAARDRAFT_200154 [Jaapia argillacea MUCL 33604]